MPAVRRHPPSDGASPARRPPSTASAVGRFMLGSLVAIAVVVVGGFFALRSVAIDEAERDTRERVEAEGRLVQVAGLSDGLLSGDPRAIRRLDDVVQAQVLGGSVVRVKVWARDGRVLYADEPRLIGERFPLEPEEAELFATGGSEAELSDLRLAENRFERDAGELLEAHTVVRLPDGTPVLFEIYQRFSSVTASGERILGTLAPPLLAGLAVLLLFQAPLAWGMARRLRRGHAEREHLLAAAVASSAAERRRIAADLHDGVVQDLAGVAFGLAPLADDARRRGDEDGARVLDGTVERLRQGVRDLRTTLVELHPPNVGATGLAAALEDLLSPLRRDGTTASLDVDPALAAGTRHDELVYRTAREAVRNVRRHARAGHVDLVVRATGDGGVALRVADDGVGFDAADRAARAAEGHVGLRLATELAAGAGGRLAVSSTPGAGTVVDLELPA
ncbi:histidine kinase [Patulibacter brassicae]|uniref:Histidine kinase n=1 Tax=Patulibacter brassicae TaxID=1705717 RepID=A0ABU4VFL5_9ACTN|nr:ATP-binding protein [Patulibacter brassicae]MDX8150592.1 histidine kinase [Patulibacter brassicae]